MEEINIQMPKDLEERINKNILLTGAGFSKDFGGLLADEISTYLFNSDEITPSIKSKIAHSENSNYEDVYHFLSRTDQYIYEKLLLDIFKNFDKEIIKKTISYNLDKLIALFGKKESYNFIFSLNQDLLVERLFLKQGKKKQGDYNGNEAVKNNLNVIINLNFPYTNYSLPNVIKHKENSNGCIQGDDFYNFDDFVQVIKFENNCLPCLGMNYIKIHGSANWPHSEGNNILVTGKNKTESMEKFNVLKSCFAMFNKILNLKQLKVVVIGYSFSDKHINDLLLNAVKLQAKLIIIDKRKFEDFKNHIIFSENIDTSRSEFLDGVEIYIPKTVDELLNDEYWFSLLKKKLN